MRIVKLSELSEEERQKVLEQQEVRNKFNRTVSDEIRQKANQQFNDYTSKKGTYDTTKHTTSIGNLKKAYKNSSTYNQTKNSLNNYYRNSENSLWEQVKNISNDLGNNVKNIGLGADNGIKQLGNYINNQRFIKNNPGTVNKQMMSDILNKKTGINSNVFNTLLFNKNDYQAKQKLENKQKILSDSINSNNNKIQNNIDNTNNAILKKTAELAPSIGQMGVGMVANTLNPGLGALYFTGSATGSYYEDAKQRGMNNTDATVYSGIMGLMEGATEQIGIENLSKAGKGIKAVIKGTGKEAIKDTTKQVTKSNLKSVLKDYGVGIADNVIQEAIIDPIQELTAGLVAGKDKSQWEDIGKKMLQDGINGGLVSAILGGANLGIQSCTGIVEKIQNNQTVTQQELKAGIKDASKHLDTKKMITSEIEQQVNKYKDYYTRKALNNNTQNILKQAENIIQENNTPKLLPQLVQKEQNTATQQIIQQKNKRTQTVNVEQIKVDSDNFAKQVDAVKNGTFPVKDMLTLGRTPQVLKDIGLPDLPITMTQKHLDTIMNESGKYKNANYHGLGEEIVKQLPEAINNPLDILQSSTRDDSIVLTTYLADKQNRTIIASIKIDGKGTINDIRIDTNVMTSAYGRNNYDKFMQENIKNGNLLYDVDQGVIKKVTGARLQLPRRSNFSTTGSSITNSILPTQQNVNSDTITNNYMQNNINNTQEKIPTRHDVIQKNRNIARENIKNISTWKDKKRGLSYQLETMERNMYDIIPDKAEAKKMNETYFEPIHISEAERQKFINNYNNKIKAFNLNKQESEAVQFLGEKKYNPDFNKGSREDILARNEIENKIKKNIEKGKISQEKVDNAIEEFRKIYDELFELENNILKENGYKEKPYRKGYFPHFIDYTPETKTEKALNALGFKIDKRPLPTDIAGITEQFVPGKTWNRSALERKGNKTDYNALKGFDTYIAQASDNIFHTENIQKLRGLENEIRYQYSDKGVQERIDNILNDETLYEDEKQALLDKILEQVNNPMPNLVTELRRYTNALANKKSEADRSIENMIGRPIYSTVNAIENRFGANAVGLNIGSAITNFIPITQAYSQVSTKNMGRAIIDTVKSYTNNDGFVDKSAFLTSRLNQSEKLYKTSLEKISDKTSFLFNAIDEVTSNIVVRGKYLENIQNGMSEAEAIKNADQFARNVIADRSKGALPTKFEEKNPVTKMFTQFQLEVNNQYRYMFKDLPRDLAEKGLAGIALALFKMFVGAWLYNEASEKITGRKPAFSPIDIAVSSYKTATDKKQTTAEKIINISTDIMQDAPLVGGFFGGGRVPVNGAIPNLSNLVKAGVGLATGEINSKKAVNTIGKELSKPLYYILPPFGGGQIKKSIEGVTAVKNGGSFGVDNKGEEILQFPVENANAGDYIKAGIFGKYALPEAKTYTDNRFKSLNAKQTKTYKEANLPYKEFLEYKNADLKKNEEKIAYIKSKNMTEQQKWGIYKNDIFSDKEREKDNGSQLKDAEYITSNGISKTKYIEIYNKAIENNLDMPTADEYKEMKQKGITLENYIDYKVKVKDEIIKQRDSGELKETQDLKDKDKISILVNQKYSAKEKKEMYEKYINNKDKKIALIEDLELPITEYLKFKAQGFVNDKDEDGETISGTKKQKVYNYLNSIPDTSLSQDYKKIICKISGINDKNYNKDIVNFVNNYPGLDGEKRKELLKIIGFDVDKKGNITNTTMLPIKKNVK